MNRDTLFLEQKYHEQLIDIFKKTQEKYHLFFEIWAYGSRIKNEISNSDLDLVFYTLFNESTQNTYFSIFLEIKTLIQESTIPIWVDFHHWSSLPSSFQQQILKKHVIMYSKKC